jgi:tRNA_anti-like
MTRLLQLSCLATLLACIGCGQRSEETNVPSGKATNSPSPQGEPVLTAESLSEEFFKDEEAADKKYQGKTLTIFGTIGLVQPEINLVVLLGKRNPAPIRNGPSIEFKLPADAAKLEQLVTGQTAKITGTYKGLVKFSGDSYRLVTLSDCRLNETSPDPSITVSAAQLAKEFAANAAEANERYKDKWLILDGKVTRVDQVAVSGTTTLFLETSQSADKMHFQVVCYSDYGRSLSSVKEGDTVTVRAYYSRTMVVGNRVDIQLGGGRVKK